MTMREKDGGSKFNFEAISRVEKTHGNATISPLLALAEGLKMHLQEHLNFDHQEFL